MSLRTVAYLNGKPVRIDEGPSHAGAPSRAGHLVTGGPGAYEAAQISQRKRTQADRAAARALRETTL